MLMRAANVNMTFLPYPGAAPEVNALLGQHVTSVFATYSTASEHLSAGRLRALAVATRTRIEQLPDVPTVAESGYKDYEWDYWLGSGEYAEENGLPTRRLVDGSIAGTRVQGEARAPGALFGRDLRCRFCRSSPETI